jgi:spore coat protein U-like protein
MLLTILLAGHLAAPALRAAECNFVAGDINFGTYDLLTNQPSVTSGTVTVTCNPAKPRLVTVTLSAGQSGTFASRQMSAGPGDRLLYNIFTDSSFTTVFGDGNGGSRSLTNSVIKNVPWVITYYGRMPAGQDVAAGLYGDRLVLTVDF